MNKLYSYTILYQDGTTDVLPPSNRLRFDELRNILDCDLIELIPSYYYNKKGWGKCAVYGDEEARFNSENYTNPHFHITIDDDGRKWDIVGTCIKEEVFHEQK